MLLSPVFQCIYVIKHDPPEQEKEKGKTAFSSVAKKKGDFWCENSISVISGTRSQLVFVFTDGGGDSNTRGKKEIRNNWKQPRLVEGKWVDRDEHFSMQPQKRNGISPRDQTGEKGYEAVI